MHIIIIHIREPKRAGVSEGDSGVREPRDRCIGRQVGRQYSTYSMFALLLIRRIPSIGIVWVSNAHVTSVTNCDD